MYVFVNLRVKFLNRLSQGPFATYDRGRVFEPYGETGREENKAPGMSLRDSFLSLD